MGRSELFVDVGKPSTGVFKKESSCQRLRQRNHVEENKGRQPQAARRVTMCTAIPNAYSARTADRQCEPCMARAESEIKSHTNENAVS